jgi:lysophosphatidate acyltransferase
MIVGTRRNTAQIHEFKKGAFNVAIQAQIPIVPVVVSSYRTFLDDKKRIFNSGEIIIEALPEISTKGLTNDDINQLMERCRQIMIDKYNDITHEIQMRNPNNLMKSQLNSVDGTKFPTY